MHILIGLAIATVLVIGWWHGNLFVCVFATLPISMFMAAVLAGGPDPNHQSIVLFMLSLGALVLVWLPRYLQRRRRYPWQL